MSDPLSNLGMFSRHVTVERSAEGVFRDFVFNQADRFGLNLFSSFCLGNSLFTRAPQGKLMLCLGLKIQLLIAEGDRLGSLQFTL